MSDRKLLNGGFVCWKSYNQKFTAASSIETEYFVLRESVRKLHNLRRGAMESGINQEAMMAFEDNQACMK